MIYHLTMQLELLSMNYIIYIIAAGSALILGLLLKQPLLPEEPKRHSWTISAIFPTAVLALGFTAMVSKLDYFTSSNIDYFTALAIGIITAIFSKFILERILPRPTAPDDKSGMKNSSKKPPEESIKKAEDSKTDKSAKPPEELNG